MDRKCVLVRALCRARQSDLGVENSCASEEKEREIARFRSLRLIARVLLLFGDERIGNGAFRAAAAAVSPRDSCLFVRTLFVASSRLPARRTKRATLCHECPRRARGREQKKKERESVLSVVSLDKKRTRKVARRLRSPLPIERNSRVLLRRIQSRFAESNDAA